MASIQLDASCLQDAGGDPSLIVEYYTSDKSESRSLGGDVRTYAGGRQRSIAQEGTRHEIKHVMRDLDSRKIAVVQQIAGTTCLYRDHLGRKMYCTFFDYEIHDRSERGYYDVSITLIEVSYDESAAFTAGF